MENVESRLGWKRRNPQEPLLGFLVIWRGSSVSGIAIGPHDRYVC